MEFTNPIGPRDRDSADPWIVWHNGFYHLTYTRGDRIKVTKAPTLAALPDAPPFT